MTQCFKITQNVPFEIFNWGIFHQLSCLSGNTVWPKPSGLKPRPNDYFGHFYELSSTLNVNVAGFARCIECLGQQQLGRKKNPRKSSWDFQHCRGGLIPLLWSVAHFPSRDYFLMMLHDDNTTTTTVEELTLSTSSLKLPFKLLLLLWLWDEL